MIVDILWTVGDSDFNGIIFYVDTCILVIYVVVYVVHIPWEVLVSISIMRFWRAKHIAKKIGKVKDVFSYSFFVVFP